MRTPRPCATCAPPRRGLQRDSEGKGGRSGRWARVEICRSLVSLYLCGFLRLSDCHRDCHTRTNAPCTHTPHHLRPPTTFTKSLNDMHHHDHQTATKRASSATDVGAGPYSSEAVRPCGGTEANSTACHRAARPMLRHHHPGMGGSHQRVILAHRRLRMRRPAGRSGRSHAEPPPVSNSNYLSKHHASRHGRPGLEAAGLRGPEAPSRR